MKLFLGNLNFGPCPPHSISTYTYGMTIALRVCSGCQKFMIMVRSVTNKIIKKMIKLISQYHYGAVFYHFTYLKKWNIKSLLIKGMCKDSHILYLYIYIDIKVFF